MKHITGHHHLSMLTKSAPANNYFYTEILGLHRVKVTVNQDDPTMYHLFYGDRFGAPGTELTFFEMPYVGSTYRGTNAITKIGLVVTSEASLHYWKNRFTEYGVNHGEITTYAGRPALLLTDTDGLQLILQVETDSLPPEWEVWLQSPVPEEHQIRGIGTVEMTVRHPEKLARTLTELFHYEEAVSIDGATVFQSIRNEIFGEILVKERDGKRERPGRGSIHHLAIRAKDEEELHHWDERVKQRGFESTGVIDRYYFHSLYFRESNGILFEIATDGPGFMIDSSEAELGKELSLPPFLQGRRAEIETKLQPIHEW